MQSTRKRYGYFGWELYHNEIGIHTFELQYQFNLNTESEILQTMYSRAIWEQCKREDIFRTQKALLWLLHHSPELLCDGIQDCIFCESYFPSETIRSVIRKRKGWKSSTKEQMWQMQKDLYRTESFDRYFSPYRTMEEWKELTEEEKICTGTGKTISPNC